ncbi:membrane protein insertion efficiency factor YidD [Kribbella sp. NPDC055110]
MILRVRHGIVTPSPEPDPEAARTRRGCDWAAARHAACGRPARKQDCKECACNLPAVLSGLIALLSIAGRTSRVRTAPRTRTTVPARAAVTAIRAYQRWLSPRLGFRCRYQPSCSQYGLAAIARYGLGLGADLTASPIRRCTDEIALGTPDPVPDDDEAKGLARGLNSVRGALAEPHADRENERNSRLLRS